MVVSIEITTASALKEICNRIYVISLGDFWYEKIYRPKWKRFLYEIYCYLVQFLTYGVVFLEFVEAIMYTFPKDLHTDATNYAVAQINVFFRLYLFKRRRKEIGQLIKQVINLCHGHEKDNLLKYQKRKIKIATTLQFIAVYSALCSYAMEGLRRYYYEGEIFVSVVTYWPFYEDRSYFAVTFRVLLIPIMYFMMATMIFAETLIMSLLIIVSLKFITIKDYFEDIKENFLNNYSEENSERVVKKLRNDCLNGILMHRELLRVVRMVHKEFDLSISLQICQSTAVAVSLLMRLALQQHTTLSNLFMSSFFILALYIQLALYLWNAGDITFNAALIPDAIFHCGWYMCPMERRSHTDIRRLVLMGCAQAQRPVVLKSFGIQDLSYETFAAVLKTTYSLFAVFRQ